jgi:CRISPR-associated protein Csm4
MNMTIVYKIEPRGPFHFGERGIGIEETGNCLHSDTLFAAIATAWRMLGGDFGHIESQKENNLCLLEPFSSPDKPPFLLSSAFPCAGELLFFPRPLVSLGTSKESKKIAYISEGAWESLCKGEAHSEPELIQGGLAWVTVEEREQIAGMIVAARPEKERKPLLEFYDKEPKQIKIWAGDNDPPIARVSLDRVNSRSELYHQGRLHFEPGCGLYFVVQINDASYRSHIEGALNFLEDSGLGGRRTSGNGQFRYRIINKSLPQVSGANCQVVLSLYHPGEAEVKGGLLASGRYDLLERRGWIGSPDGHGLRHRTLRMLTEGSVFPIGKPLLGTVENVKPIEEEDAPYMDHPVWRYGLALTIRLRLRDYEHR